MSNETRDAFEAWAVTILSHNPTWKESGEGELARQAWQAATLVERERAALVVETYPQWLGRVGKKEITGAIMRGCAVKGLKHE